jgi:hypothetical protein
MNGVAAEGSRTTGLKTFLPWHRRRTGRDCFPLTLNICEASRALWRYFRRCVALFMVLLTILHILVACAMGMLHGSGAETHKTSVPLDRRAVRLVRYGIRVLARALHFTGRDQFCPCPRSDPYTVRELFSLPWLSRQIHDHGMCRLPRGHTNRASRENRISRHHAHGVGVGLRKMPC